MSSTMIDTTNETHIAPNRTERNLRGIVLALLVIG